jgi:hypothetical protein
LTWKLAAGVLVAAALAGCETGPTVRTDVDPNAYAVQKLRESFKELPMQRGRPASSSTGSWRL